MLSLHFCRFSSEGCSTCFTYEQNPDKASIYQQTRIESRFLPKYSFTSLNFTNSVHKKLSKQKHIDKV